MIKKKNLLIFFILFLTNCGFYPIYSQNNNVNFSIEEIKYKGDRDINNFLKINLNKYKNSKLENKIFIDVESFYEKNIFNKDGTGKIKDYELKVEVIFLISNKNKKIKISEKKIMKNFEDKIEEARYEKSIKENFASSISTKLISELIINK